MGNQNKFLLFLKGVHVCAIHAEERQRNEV